MLITLQALPLTGLRVSQVMFLFPLTVFLTLAILCCSPAECPKDNAQCKFALWHGL